MLSTFIRFSAWLCVLFTLTYSALAQTNTPCPNIDIGVPRPQGEFFGRGERLPLTAIVNPPPENSEWRASWEFSPAIPFTDPEQSPNYIQMGRRDVKIIEIVATPDLQSTTVSVTLQIEGLPPDCPNRKTASFKIQFSEEAPRQLAKMLRGGNPDIEETALFSVSNMLEKADATVNALFVVDYSKTDTKRSLRSYVARVRQIMTSKFAFPDDKIAFAFAKKSGKGVIAYGWPTERRHAFETDIEKLDIPE